jgi:hypothetical protein
MEVAFSFMHIFVSISIKYNGKYLVQLWVEHIYLLGRRRSELLLYKTGSSLLCFFGTKNKA